MRSTGWPMHWDRIDRSPNKHSNKFNEVDANIPLFAICVELNLMATNLQIEDPLIAKAVELGGGIARRRRP